MKTFNYLTPIETSRINASIASEHNLKLIGHVLHNSIQSCNKDLYKLSLLTEAMFELLDNYIMNNSDDFDDRFFSSFKNEFHLDE